jgi:polyhydroxyalkanoate synthase
MERVVIPETEELPLSLDQAFHASLARLTGGISPTALLQAHIDWLLHIGLSPDKAIQLTRKTARKWERLFQYCARIHTQPDQPCCIEPLPQDTRFDAEAWQRFPYNVIYQSFLLAQQWWYNATTDVPGVTRHHEDVVTFTMRQLLDMVSPSNFAWTNPVVLERTARDGGMNLLRGAFNFWEDVGRRLSGAPPQGTENFRPGKEVAITPGKVVFKNRLIELIQYSPATKDVRPEPMLIVPAWIMKYYILDLSPKNSLVKYLVDNGFTVFMISWKNPGEEDRNLGMEEYRKLGIMAALDAVSKIVPDRRIHCTGYCLGGTLLTVAAAAIAQNSDDRVNTLTLLAAQTDFTEAGELTLFIDEDQVRFLEEIMSEKGYLDSRQMAGAFQLLRSNDLIWSRMVQSYLMGEREPMFDLMAWNVDATRMPYRMHSEYLRKLFLANDLAEARYKVDGRPISLTDIRTPIFAVSTLADHVAPWRSVYKIKMLTDADVTFVLSNGGHNAGIVSPPGHPRRRHQIATHKEGEIYIDPDLWQATAHHHEGSWWPCWLAWLGVHSSEPVPPPKMGAPEKGLAILGDAPGEYVLAP